MSYYQIKVKELRSIATSDISHAASVSIELQIRNEQCPTCDETNRMHYVTSFVILVIIRAQITGADCGPSKLLSLLSVFSLRFKVSVSHEPLR